MRKLAERAARHIAWRLVRIAGKRLGIPWFLWPVMWISRKFLERQLRKHGLTYMDVYKALMERLWDDGSAA